MALQWFSGANQRLHYETASHPNAFNLSNYPCCFSISITWYLLIVTEDKISHILVIFIHYGGWFLSSIPCRKKWFQNLLRKLCTSMCGCAHTHAHTTMKYHICSVAKLCSILCDPRNYSPPDSSVHGISQARILEWVAMTLSRGSSWPRDRTHVSSPALAGRFFTTSSTWMDQLASFPGMNWWVKEGNHSHSTSVPTWLPVIMSPMLE